MFSLSNRGVAARDPSPFHPARPGTVAQQIRALVSVGLGQRHKSCHVTASRWWPLGGTWPTNRLGDFSEEWMVQKKNNGLKNQPPIICGMIMSLICMMVGCCHLLSGMMMSPSHDGKIVICFRHGSLMLRCDVEVVRNRENGWSDLWASL